MGTFRYTVVLLSCCAEASCGCPGAARPLLLPAAAARSSATRSDIIYLKHQSRLLILCWRWCSGGGEVFLGRGQYWLSGPIVVPPGVRLVGEGTQLVSIYFKEAAKADAPKPSYVFSAWQNPPPPP